MRPRLVATTEWTSSTITVADVGQGLAALGGEQQEAADSGVVIGRRAGGGEAAAVLGRVSPVRIPTVMSRQGLRPGGRRPPGRGQGRPQAPASMSAARALSG